MKPKFLLLFLLALAFLPWAACADETVKIGDQSLTVPIPEGFTRYDGLNATVDKVMQSLLPASNRSLMFIATPDDAAKAKAGMPDVLVRFMNIQTLRAAENLKITPADFSQVITGLEKQFAAGGKGIGDFEAELNQRIKDSGLGVDLKVGQSMPLGVYEKGATFVDVGLLMKTQMAGAEPQPLAAAASFALVHGKVIYLYVYAQLKSAKDVEWTRQTAKAWREKIIAVNPE